MGIRSVARVLALVSLALASLWGVAGTALMPSAVADAAFAVSDNTGMVRVDSNVTGAGFTLNGPEGGYSGTAPWSRNDAPVGYYSITWDYVLDHTTPSNPGQQLEDGGEISFYGDYGTVIPQTGTIEVTANAPGATFTITGKASYSGTAPETYADAPAGSYTITWNSVEGYNTPSRETKELSSGGGISFTGNYAEVPLTGTISVTANMPRATFTIEGKASYSGTAPETYADAPAGSYTITWGALAGMNVPASQTQTLAGGGSIAFSGTYVDNVPPIIASGPSVTETTPTTATVVWTTNEPADSQVEYGLDVYYGFTTPLNPALVTSHSVTITGLNPGTWYNCRVSSRDLAGNPVGSGTLEFLTPDDVPPVISSVIVTDISSSSTTVKWDTDERSDAQVEYGLTANYGSITAVDSILVYNHSVAVTGLAPQTTYHFRVISTDYWGNSSTSPDAIFTTTDIDAPIISGVAATAITDTSAIIVWFTDSPAQSSVEYGTSTSYDLLSVFDNTMVTGHSVALPDLVAQTTYHYKVKSRDASGLWSESPDYTFTTGIDMGTDPPRILFLTPGEPTSSGTTISWSTDEMAISHVEYGLKVGEDGGYDYATAPSTVFKTLHVVPVTGLKSGMTYHFRVVSTDAAGNTSASEDRTFNTPMGRAPLPSLPAWAWAVVGVAGALVVGALVVKNR